MRVAVTNAQQTLPVDVKRIARLARCAVRRLAIHEAGTLAITFIDGRRMRQLNRRFLHHDRSTDVLSFRYNGERIVGDILIDPRQAQRYAAQRAIPYRQELSRYVVHGILHWLGHEDGTAAQRRTMRAMEDRLLADCMIPNAGGGMGRETGGAGNVRRVSLAPRLSPRIPL